MTQVTETLAYRGDIGSVLGRERGVGGDLSAFSVFSVLSVFCEEAPWTPSRIPCVE